jgi:hypothetical protein
MFAKLKFSGAFTVKVGTVVVIVVVVVEVAFLYFVVSCGIYKSVFWKVGFMESNWQSNYS